MSIGNMHRNKSQKSSSPQLVFEVSLFRFHFDSVLHYLDCYYNEYLGSKQRPHT